MLPHSYLSPSLVSISFGDLDNHLKRLRHDVMAPMDPKPKRATAGASKQNEDKKRKNKASQGVEKLKKANLNGMSKLSSYFKKT